MTNMLNAKGTTDEYTKYKAPTTGLPSTDPAAPEMANTSYLNSLQARGPSRRRGTEPSSGLIGGSTDYSAEEQQEASLSKASASST